ncbi:unnamed protein product [Albugo candida]|uniref:UPF3 domain-containing protein n=1 Tax=Albugo candida TaxID=65357 RepID=A0A024GE00_9STRA|nr:unnamed protein product [Albugo candida]|eukprot:CCI45106.1 unnamed protein product [Albugo candida]
METNRPSGKPQSRGGRGRIEKEESFETIKGSSVQEFIPAAHKAIEQQRTTRTKTSNIERVLLSRSAAKYKKADAKKRKNAAKWRGNSLNTDSRISRYKETTSPCKVLIRNIPPSVSFDEMREILTPYDISDKMIWRYVMGKTRMNERPCTTGRMYLDFRSDTAKAVDFIASLNGYAIECTQKDSKRNLEVAYAPSRRLPGDRKRRDTNAEEIFQDQSYLDFIEALNAPAQKPSVDSTSQEVERIEQPIPALVQFLNEKKGRERPRKGNNFDKKKPTTKHFRKHEDSKTKKSKSIKNDTQTVESKDKIEKAKTRKPSRRQESKSDIKANMTTNICLHNGANKTEANVKPLQSAGSKSGTYSKHKDSQSEKTRKKVFAPKSRAATEPQSLLV